MSKKPIKSKYFDNLLGEVTKFELAYKLSPSLTSSQITSLRKNVINIFGQENLQKSSKSKTKKHFIKK